MSVDKMSVDEMSVDKMSVGKYCIEGISETPNASADFYCQSNTNNLT
jgi:hypothetical protein